jgi:TM2 domain-containing membrane protein YozV
MPDQSPGGRDREQPDSPEQNTSAPIAAVASAVVPGAGQVYNRQLSKGASLLLLAGLSVVLLSVGIGLVTYVVVWAYAVYDAYHGGVSVIELPAGAAEGFALWRGLLVAVLGSLLLVVGGVFELFLLGGASPPWALALLSLGGLLVFFGTGWYWIVRPLYKKK